MRLLIAPSAAEALHELPRDDALKLLGRCLTLAANPATKARWAHYLVTPGFIGRRVSHAPWHALCRLDYTASVVVVDHIGRGKPHHAAEVAALEAAEALERAVGPAIARADHLLGEQLFRELQGSRC